MKEYIEERAVAIANYIIDHNATVRQTAKKFGISKSTCGPRQSGAGREQVRAPYPGRLGYPREVSAQAGHLQQGGGLSFGEPLEGVALFLLGEESLYLYGKILGKIIIFLNLTYI